MTRTLKTIALLAGIASATGAVLAQGQVTGFAVPLGQIRDGAPAPAPTGTSVVSGVVTTDDAQSEPIRRATVLLAAGDIRLPLTAITDDAGRFAFADVAGGNYTIVASKPGYVTSFYGAKKPGRGPGVPIAVLDNQRVGNVRVKMLHGGVITGLVRRQAGQPAAGVSIQVLPVQTAGGMRRPGLGLDESTPFARSSSQMGQAVTDDRGVYRVFGLAPGEYLVMTQGRGIESFISNDVRQVTQAEVQWAQSAASPMNPGSGSPAPEPGQTVTYSTVYYPGTADAASATTVTLGPNEERSGVDFAMTLVPTAKVTGTVLDQDGQPMAGATVQVQPKQRGNQSTIELALTMFSPGGNGRTQPDGTFTLSGVTPGDYTVSVRAQPKSATAGNRTANPGLADIGLMIGMLGGGGGATPTLWASEDISVSGREVSGLSLRLQPGMTVSGKVVYQGSVLPPPTDLTKTRVSLSVPPTGTSPVDQAMSMMGGSMATVSADGTFVVKGVVPGKYRAGVFAMSIMSLAMSGASGGPNNGWYLKSAMLNGRDVADIPFDVRANEDVSGIVMTFTDKPTEVSGSVIDQAGRAVPDFPIVIFSTDKSYWTVGSRRAQQVRPASDGKYKITALPAGEYYVCAVTDLEPDSLSDPTFLEMLVPGSFKITLAEGEKKVQDLKLQGGG